ncbi:hypothetical protein VP01_595g4 [Puccinia sorghi]|uniref:GH26 domain-containing protein n=1 Tax=Puccinia sorghi TaxID=27349 RepID=A0A0L6UHP0_9BASI|nr:hypothetical protein VP01_595g4 [Puccinia sorghi]
MLREETPSNTGAGISHRRRRQAACPPDEEYDNPLDTQNGYAAEGEERRDLSPSQTQSESYWDDSSYSSSQSSRAPGKTGSFQNGTSGNLTDSLAGYGNFSQPMNGSQFNISTAGAQLANNGSSNSANQTNSTSDLGNASSSMPSELPANGMKKHDLFLGFLPDDGASGGTRQTMAQLNSAIGSKAAVYGWYAQAHSGVPFDGSQLLWVIDDVKACNCVFQPAVMPVDGWQGLTSSDNSQAVAIANVMKKFTDEGIPVWLRFAHEMNYYQTDGTYQGTAEDFKAGWAAVSAAIKQIAPSVKMFWTPNVSSEDDYARYEPDDMTTVDFVGIDYYPKKLSGNDFLDNMQNFHDKYAVDGRKFAIGETGLGWSGSLDDKAKWFNEICAAKASMPQFVAMAWFNYDKEYDYKIAGALAEPEIHRPYCRLKIKWHGTHYGGGAERKQTS